MRVLAALSGGVDSECGSEGCRGRTRGRWSAYGLNPKNAVWVQAAAVWLKMLADAARAAEIMGIPFYVWDLAEEF